MVALSAILSLRGAILGAQVVARCATPDFAAIFVKIHEK